MALLKVHTGNELMFHPIRRYIMDGDLSHEPFVMPVGPHFIEPLQLGYAPELFSHYFGVGRAHGHITAGVQFYVGPEHVTPASHIRLAVTRNRVEPCCHRVVHYGDKINNFDGVIQDITDRTQQ
jgi:hypothetical protein